MPGSKRRRLVPMLALGFLLHPTAAPAGSDPYFKGSLSAWAVDDDNLFSTASGKEKDVITRLTPRLEAGIRSVPLTASALYTFDAESFADHPELDNPRMRERAAFDLKTAEARRVSLSLTGAWARTETPGELNTTTGVLAGRFAARRLEVDSSIRNRLGPGTSLVTGLSLTRDEASGGPGIDSRIGSLALEHGVTPRDRLSAEYLARRFDFDEGGRIVAHSVTLGWTRNATPQTDFSLLAGPRLLEGAVRPEASASLRHRFKKGDLSCAYTSSMTTIIGQVGAASFESLAVAADFHPLRSLDFGVAPSAVRVTGVQGAADLDVYVGAVHASWQFNPWLALVGSYQFNLQRGIAGAEAPEVTRDVALLRLVASGPGRGGERVP